MIMHTSEGAHAHARTHRHTHRHTHTHTHTHTPTHTQRERERERENAKANATQGRCWALDLTKLILCQKENKANPSKLFKGRS